MDTVTTTIRLPTDLKKRIGKLAKSHRTTFTELVKVALETELLLSQTAKTGGRIVLHQADGTQKELVIR